MMPQTIITDIAEEKITLAAGSGGQVAITHIALGDGGGQVYAPTYDQTALRNERARLPVAVRHRVGGNTWRVTAEFGIDTTPFEVREIGFFDADNTLITLWAGLDVVPRQTGVLSYLVDHVLNFSRVPEGVMIVDAPDDHLLNAYAIQARAITNLQLEQLRQAEKLRGLLGHY